jgi:type IV pilus assembly protein PilO
MIANILIRLASFSFQKTLIFSAILGGIYYMMAFDDGSSIQVKITEAEKKVQDADLLAKKSDEALKEVEAVRATVGALSEQFKTVSQALPSEVQMTDIIRTVDFVSRKSGVSIKTKEPKPVINRDYYEEIPLKISLEGTYAEITTFLFLLASTERIMKVNNFTVTLPKEKAKGTGPGRLVFEGQVISYRFIGVQTPVATTPPGGKKK